MKPLWQRDPANNDERASLDLASALSRAAGDNVVSWAHQVEAAAYVREHGWAAAVERTVDIETRER